MCRHLTVFAQQLLHAGQLAGCPEIPASRSAAPERVSQSKPSASTAATGWRGTHLYPDPVVAAPLSSTNRLDTACGGGGQIGPESYYRLGAVCWPLERGSEAMAREGQFLPAGIRTK